MPLRYRSVKRRLIMNALPSPDQFEELIVRTDYSSNEAWQELRNRAEFEINDDLIFYEDSQLENATGQQVFEQLPAEFEGTAIYVADKMTFTGPEFTLLVVAIWPHVGIEFRASV